MPPSPTKTSLNVGTSAMMMNLYMSDLSCFLKQKCGEFYIFKQFFVSLKAVVIVKRMFFCLSLFSLSLSLFVRVYEVRKVPSSYRQYAWKRTVIVEEVLYTFGVVVLVRFSRGVGVPRRFGGFVQVLQTVQVAVLWLHNPHAYSSY